MKTIHAVAGYLPGLVPTDVQWKTLVFETPAVRLEVAMPVLSQQQTTSLARRVKAASDRHLKTMTVSQIVAVVDRAIARLLDSTDPYRQQADLLLPIVSGYDSEMVRLGLTEFLKNFRAAQLHRFVAEDFANPKILDEFQPRPKGGATMAFGPELLVHSWAGNVPALPLWSLVCGLLVKAGNIGKLPSAEPVFASLFARLVAEVHPPLADCLAVMWWKGGDEDQASALYAEADTVLAYGSNESLEALSRRLPVTTRLLTYGHKIAVGLVGAVALDTVRAMETARLAAWDVMRYDQQGCYSPHVFYVERGGKVTPREFAQHFAGELANLQNRFPRRALLLEDSYAVARWRQSIELQSISARQGSADELIGDETAAFVVVYGDALQVLAPTPLNRTIRVVAVDALDQVIAHLAPHRLFLQTAGVAAAPAELFRLSGLLGAAGVTRITAIGSMTAPESGWHHDGRFNLLDLVRMVDIEQSAETAADRMAPYAN